MPNIKVKKSEWIELGAEVFSKEGVNGLNVEKMARALKCNKSGFYWYFKNRQVFLEEIVQYWVEKTTDEIIELADKSNSPIAKFIDFINEMFKNQSYKDFMFHLRKVAVNDSEIEKLVAGAENKRIKYIQDLLVGLKYSRNDAFIKSKILYQFYIGWYELNKHREITDEMLKGVIDEISHFIDMGK